MDDLEQRSIAEAWGFTLKELQSFAPSYLTGRQQANRELEQTKQRMLTQLESLADELTKQLQASGIDGAVRFTTEDVLRPG